MEIQSQLVRLSSSLLPVGSFAYSRGLEYAVHSGLIDDFECLRDWIFGVLEYSFATLDAPVYVRMLAALNEGSIDEFQKLDTLLASARESRELYLEDQRMAEALQALLSDLDGKAEGVDAYRCKSFTAAFALASQDVEADLRSGLFALMWSVCEAQVAAAIRLSVIGQSDGQRLLKEAPERIERCIQSALNIPDEDIGNVAFTLSVISAKHEVQYSRLFRS